MCTLLTARLHSFEPWPTDTLAAGKFEVAIKSGVLVPRIPDHPWIGDLGTLFSGVDALHVGLEVIADPDVIREQKASRDRPMLEPLHEIARR